MLEAECVAEFERDIAGGRRKRPILRVIRKLPVDDQQDLTSGTRHPTQDAVEAHRVTNVVVLHKVFPRPGARKCDIGP